VGGHLGEAAPIAAANCTMRVLIFHGYLLAGTGSNVYNAEVAQALLRLGHEVHLLCQDRHPERAAFVDAAGDWDTGQLTVVPLRDGPRRCIVYRPAIGDLLPVYVQDRYEGMQARTFADCSDEEIDGYVEANVAAVREVAQLVRPDVALANHLVMGPVILARALSGLAPYAAKVHGSALEYTVKPELPRFLPFAREGIAGAGGVLVGSRHTAESLWKALGGDWVGRHDVLGRTRLGSPGVDVRAFGPRNGRQAAARLKVLSQRLGTGAACEPEGQGPTAPPADAFARDEARAAQALSDFDAGGGPIVAYVGKLIVSKGVDLLLAAWPLVLQRLPSAQLAIVGFGAFQEALEAMANDLAAGRLDAVVEAAQAGRALEGGPKAPLSHLLAFVDALAGDHRDRYLAAAALLADSVRFTGRLDHEELADLLPACEAVVVPSTFPEAFGMVAVEAAACGALPISAAHSGLAEVSDRLAAAVGQPAASWLSFPVDDQAIWAIADRLIGWLTAPVRTRAAASEAIVATVRHLWSWEGVAEGIIAAAQGRVQELPAP
jgi:glycosyltransferase involved in cell wall biosynthesis